MTVQEPGSLEVFITVAAGNLASGVFKEYVDRLDLKGNERVLELGPSAGNSSRHLAKRLLKGGGRLICVDISRVWVQVAQKRLGKFPNVEVKLGDIATLDIPDASQDVVFISFALHDIPAHQRPGLIMHLVHKLVPGGRVFLREPLRFISQEEIRKLMQQFGLIEISSSISEVKSQGQTFEGVYCLAG